MIREAPDLHANHGPIDRHCPFCIVATGGETSVNTQRDIVRQNKYAVALISPRWWPHNKGHVLIVSKFNYETVYELPREHGHAIQDPIPGFVSATARQMYADRLRRFFTNRETVCATPSGVG